MTSIVLIRRTPHKISDFVNYLCVTPVEKTATKVDCKSASRDHIFNAGNAIYCTRLRAFVYIAKVHSANK